MPYSVILHIQNSDPVLAEVEELPSTQDTMVKALNPRRTDGKDLHYLADNVLIVYWPLDRINFLEIVSSREEEEIFGFVRE